MSVIVSGADADNLSDGMDDMAALMDGIDTAPASAAIPVFDDRFLQDPYPVYRTLRDAGPIQWRDDIFQGAWLLPGYADVEGALADPCLSSQRTGGWINRIPGLDEAFPGRAARARLDAFRRLFGRAMVFLDAPDHVRLRHVVAAGFHPSLIRALAPQVEMLAEELLAPLDNASQFDFIEAFARPFPSRVIALVLGIERSDERRFMDWTDDIAAFIGALQPTTMQLHAAQRSLLRLVQYFEALLARRRRSPGSDFVSRLLLAEAQGQMRPDGELLAQCAMLLFAGHETTRNLLGNGLYTLLTHPDQWTLLRSRPELMQGAIREMLRYESPVQYTARRVAIEFTLHGQRLRRGDLVIAIVGAANRDPHRFSDPDRFDIRRRDGAHLSFGRGAHVCVGAGVAMLEAEVALRALMRRWPDLAMAPTKPQWNGNAGLRGLKRLTLSTRGTRPAVMHQVRSGQLKHQSSIDEFNHLEPLQ